MNDVGYKMHCKENNQCFYWILKVDARARSVSRGDSSTQLFWPLLAPLFWFLQVGPHTYLWIGLKT